MKQNLLEQSNQDYLALDELDYLFDSAESQLQKTVTLLQLGTDVDQSFEGILSALNDIRDITLKIRDKDILFIISERIRLLSDRMEEVVNQYKH